MKTYRFLSLTPFVDMIIRKGLAFSTSGLCQDPIIRMMQCDLSL